MQVIVAANSSLLKNTDPDSMGYEAVVSFCKNGRKSYTNTLIYTAKKK